MQLSISKLKLGFIGVGLFFTVAIFLYTGALFPGHTSTISIEWGIEPSFEGLDVEIDGVIVGKLEKFGQATHTGFEVGAGSHTVRVIHPSFDCPPQPVEIKSAGEHVRLLLDVTDAVDRKGRMKPQLTLRG